MTELPDFDTLMWLAQHQPEKLDRLQQTLSNELIAESDSNQEQLRTINTHLRQRLARCNNPYHRCIITIRMMRNKFSALATVLENPESYRSQKAEIIPLRRKSV
ncbi:MULTISPECIES: DUF3135 domain-containing protein [Shewanella]|jgi:hypothetical protein|uniref:DUF3135 domain-containing protein n=1 Tax=Shewanella TaxID=22 RepID=UPI00167687BD|nr:DUF3135 domain-containing protein [Shewanella fodinae]MCL2905329.1 DUF3135 domain-containing protein [Shewanella fodinae]GGY90183.1 hypothetical protein GCM10007169_04160 [Shewanella fodinae]